MGNESPSENLVLYQYFGSKYLELNGPTIINGHGLREKGSNIKRKEKDCKSRVTKSKKRAIKERRNTKPSQGNKDIVVDDDY